MKIKCRDEILGTLPNPNNEDVFFLNKKKGNQKIELIDSNNRKLDYKQDDCKLCKINENVVNKELDRIKKEYNL